MSNNYGLSIHKLFPLITVLKSYNIDKTEFLESAGLDSEILESPDTRIGFTKFKELVRKAINITKEKNLGLHMGESFTGFSSILGYVLMNCKNLAEVIDKHIKYEKITNDIYKTSYTFEDNNICICCEALADFEDLEEFFYSFHLAVSYKYPQILSNSFNKKYIKKITFTFDEPKDISEYKRIFDCPVQFGASKNSMVMDKLAGDIPIINSNKELLAVFEKHAEKFLEKLQKNQQYSNKASEIIIQKLNGDSPKIGIIANELAVSTRTLQAKLKSEGTSFSELLENIRKELALNYIKDRFTPIAEIAYLLGFSEASVFHRSFKKWTNTTPGKYREMFI